MNLLVGDTSRAFHKAQKDLRPRYRPRYAFLLIFPRFALFSEGSRINSHSSGCNDGRGDNSAGIVSICFWTDVVVLVVNS
ncbi:hypothetical protein BDZ89DRAFT_1062670 [Hymenopellis radicata]|nr:hypothetical protein BDZ89DRAFT_1062670 [Hymenopellis radicata]